MRSSWELCLCVRGVELLRQPRLLKTFIGLFSIGFLYPVYGASEEPSEKSGLVNSELLLPATKSNSSDNKNLPPESSNSDAVDEATSLTDALDKVVPATPLERWLHLEKAFVRRVVPLTDSQETLLSAVTVEKAKTRKAPGGMRAPIDISRDKPQVKDDIRQPLSDGSPQTLDYRMAVRNLESAITAVLSEDQLVTYRKEKEARDQFARESGALGIALLLDRKLKLSLSQIEILRDDLAKWGGVTTIPIEAYESSDSFLPRLKDTLVLKHLTPPQFNMYVGYRQVEIESETLTENSLFDPIIITK